MSNNTSPETLVHPSLGKLPARKVLECIFALTPDGPFLHHHLEEVETSQAGGGTVYTLNGQSPAAGRERCQIIPPLVNEFDSFESLA